MALPRGVSLHQVTALPHLVPEKVSIRRPRHSQVLLVLLLLLHLCKTSQHWTLGLPTSGQTIA